MPAASPWSKSFSAEQYNSSMRLSGYEPILGTALAKLSLANDSIFEVGPGDGGLSRYLWPLQGRYQAVEIDPHMVRTIRERLITYPKIDSNVIEGDWESIDWQTIGAVDTGFAANTYGLTDGAANLWEKFRSTCRKRIIWIVPAQKGPRSWCLSGIFPPEIHGLSEKPGVETTLAELEHGAPIPGIQYFDWKFHQRFLSPEAAENFISDKMEGINPSLWTPILRENLQPYDGEWIATAPKRSAMLIWNFPTI
jgi:hypothetical protein